MRSRMGLAVAALVVACGGGTGPVALLEPGVWGGDGANLIVTPDSARAEFVCASGWLDAPIVLDSGGHFEVGGRYRLEVGPVGLPVPARWLGAVSPVPGAAQIVLAVIVSNPGFPPDTLGPFHLVKDKRVSTGLCA